MTTIIDTQDQQAIHEARRSRRANKSKGPSSHTVLSRFKSSGYEPTVEPRPVGRWTDRDMTNMKTSDTVVEVIGKSQRCNHSVVYYMYTADGEKHFGYADMDMLADIMTPKSVQELSSEHGEAAMAAMAEYVSSLQ